jgi:hypothetical protein
LTVGLSADGADADGYRESQREVERALHLLAPSKY